MSWRVLLLVLLLAPAAHAERPHVYVVVVDGLDARFVTPESMPVLYAPDPPPTIRASMPTRTNSSHASLLTGVHTEAHGITGNAYWSRTVGDPPRKTDEPGLLETETIFTVAETTAPDLVTMGAFGKPKLGHLFGNAPDKQRQPDVLWTPEAGARGVDPITNYADDATTMDAFLRLTGKREPDLAVLNLADVDRTAHGLGPDDPRRVDAVVAAGAAVQRLVDSLKAHGRWDRSIVLVTADHGFDQVAPSPTVPKPEIDLATILEKAELDGVVVVTDGGVAHVYAETDPPDDDVLEDVAEIAAKTPGVAEVLSRIPVDDDVPLLAKAHPDWHVDTPRIGDLLVVAAPNHQFVAADEIHLRGNHGSPREQAVPLAVLGGHPTAKALKPTSDTTLADVGATVGALLGIRPARRLDGQPIKPSSFGQPLVQPATP
jgi:ectonucleotide pyrophosphatase/phosphodiesterase family member 5